VGDALRRLWQRNVTEVEVTVDGAAASQKVSLKLLEKPSECVILIKVAPRLDLQSYLWFGGLPGDPLPDIHHLKVARHTKANAEGIKDCRAVAASHR
jgi:hypothetical protein